jgi:hypothetical protein
LIKIQMIFDKQRYFEYLFFPLLHSDSEIFLR